MNEQQAASIIQAATVEFRMIFKTEEDVTRGIQWMNFLFTSLYADYFGTQMSKGIMFTPNVLPLNDKEFCEVLRVFANVLEAKIDAESQEKH